MSIGKTWAALWKLIVRVDTSKIIPSIAVRNTIGVALPLAVGLWIGQLYSGLVMATGALYVSFSDDLDPYGQRARRMLLASAVCGLAVMAGATTAHSAVLAIIVAAAWAFSAGMMVALGTVPGDLGTISLVELVVFAAQPMSPRRALLSVLLAFSGGALQTGLSLLPWIRHPDEPERRALGQLYESLQRMIEAHVDASAAPPASIQSSEAEKALASRTGDYSIESARFRSLLSQAQRLRLSILAIKRLRARLRRESITVSPQIIDRVLERTAYICGEIGGGLLRNAASISLTTELDAVSALGQSVPSGSTPMADATARDVRFQIAALAGQLRAAETLASHSVGAGRVAFERQEARKPWTLRLAGSLATLRANLTLQSSAFRHALRLAFSIALGIGLGHALNLARPYWIPMTIALVLKPDFSSTYTRGVLRLAGTYVGLLFATGLFQLVHLSIGLQIVLLAAFTFLCRCFGPANYGLMTAAISGLIVLLIGLGGVAPKDVIGPRGLNTTFGGIIALLVYVAWPTWERTQLSDSMAALLEAYRRYFGQLTQAYIGESRSGTELEASRRGARVARTNMEASLERYQAEPGASTGELDRQMAMLAGSHRFAHAAMALEADLAANPSRTVPEDLARFSKDIDRAFEFLIARLRGGRKMPHEFPDLRASHSGLLQHGGSSLALLSTETDRIANSLNTLREKVR